LAACPGIVEEREALHLLEDHALRVSRIAGGHLLLIEREGPVDAKVREIGVGGQHAVLSECARRSGQPKRDDDRDQTTWEWSHQMASSLPTLTAPRAEHAHQGDRLVPASRTPSTAASQAAHVS
jgi:hypothetical protein